MLSEFFVLWSKNISFPELSLPVVVMLKRWLNEASSRTSGNKNAKINQMFALLIQKIEANSRWIEKSRSKVTFAPKDRAEVEGFLKDMEWESTPMGAFVKTQRKQRAERVKLLERSRREEAKRRSEGDDEEMAEAEILGTEGEDEDNVASDGD